LTESNALCECASIIPGVTYIPVASMTLAFAPARTSAFLPTAAILPSRIRIEPPSITPCEAVMIVAFLIRTSPLFCACATDASAAMSAVNRIVEYRFIVNSSGSRQDLQDRSEFGSIHKILKNPVNPVYFHHLGVRVPLKFESFPIALIEPRIELPSIEPFPVMGIS
jgi:hypothetical protein